MRNNTTNTRHFITIAAALALACCVVRAQTPEKKGWESSAALGFTLTRGNSDTMLLTAGLKTERKWEKDELGFGISGGYGEDNDTVNNEFIQGYGQYNHLFTERFYAGVRLDAAYDGIAELDYRFTLTPLVGYYFIKTTNTTLAVEVGPSAVLEKYSGQSDDTYLGIRFAERFEHKLTDTTKIWQSASYVPDVERWVEHYVITAEAGIEVDMNKKWSLRVVLQDVYTSEPGPGSEYNELRLIAGTGYKF